MDKIFKHPAVQYIPLQMYKSKKGDNFFNSTRAKVELNDSHSKSLYNILFYNFSDIKEGFMEIKIFNGEVKFIKYRSYEVFLVGEPLPGKYHKFQITKEYFYKDKLVFTFYNKYTGEKLAYRRFYLNN